ncbi:hypothetical protein BW247_10670 [Acidihalobacter ferrooxydans]|uniref:CobQ/CobB/MinD/ParA nucleotide binding domain-containing protein n=1 Tax=Acidihalobacter ferrooxydans TaxID=1765967 RepID=A0A1P8ULE9_9GAMM|nr:hypothetical protein BW247_10670 [Acidihalobacter ferrooxydans]
MERAADKLKQETRPQPQSEQRGNAGHESQAQARHTSIPDSLVDEVVARRERTAATATGAQLILDAPRLTAAGLYPPPDIEDRIENEYRRIKRPLLANVTGRGVMPVEDARIVMVTSAQAGEGKTYTAFNLAYSLAQERDWQVTLIDGDNTRSTLSRKLGVAGGDRPGLMDLLSDPGIDMGAALQPTNVPRLTFIAAGSRHEDAAELLASREMTNFLRRLTAEPGRIAIIDTTPLLGSAEALALSESVGQILVVIKAGVTPRAAVAAAVQPLDKRKAINLLLNQVVKEHGDAYGGYSSYVYGYGDPQKMRAQSR